MPGPNGEERRDGDELLRFMQERFDRMEDRADARFDELASEIRTTRHGQRESMEQLTVQVVELVQRVGQDERRLDVIDAWRNDGGPLDARFRRHDARLVTVERTQATAGRFTWGDVAKVIGALVGAGTLLSMIVALVLTIAAPAG